MAASEQPRRVGMEPDYDLITMPVYLAEVELIDGVSFRTQKPMPNWWWRFWQWALFGWKWKALKEERAAQEVSDDR